MFNFLLSLIVFVFSFNATDKINNNFSEIPTAAGENVPRYPTTETYENINSNSTSNEHPNTGKIEAYNTQSEKDIGKVAEVAIEKSPVLIPVTPTPMPTQVPEPPKEIPIPTIEPTPIPIKPPISIDPPKPTIIPIPEPSVYPIKPPVDPCYCPPDQYCIMIACPEVK